MAEAEGLRCRGSSDPRHKNLEKQKRNPMRIGNDFARLEARATARTAPLLIHATTVDVASSRLMQRLVVPIVFGS